MQPATWENCRAEFTREFVDLLLPEQSWPAWEKFWTALRSGPFAVTVSKGSGDIPPPETASWIFTTQELDGRMVRADVRSGGISPFCLFNYEGGDDGYPQLHVNCEEVVNAAAFESMLAVMRYLAGAVAMPVLAAGEALGPAHAFIRVSPDGQAEFLPSGAGLPHNRWVMEHPEYGPAGSGNALTSPPGRHPPGVPVPSHLADWLGPLDWRSDDPYIEGDLVCPCGRHDLEFHYPGQTHHPSHLPEPIPTVADGSFVIKAVCAACGRQAIVFDHHVHGLTRFLNAAQYSGRDLPRLVPWACSKCGRIPHRGRVHFRFPDQGMFRIYVEGACGLERWGDGIEWFGMKIECCGCGQKVDPWVGYED